MRVLIHRLNTWPVRQRAAVLESAVYLALVVAWMALWPAEAPDRLLIGRLLVAAPAAAAALQILFSLPSLAAGMRRAWLYLGLALFAWALRHFVSIVYSLTLQTEAPVVSIADLFGLLAYPLAAYGLLQFSAGFRHAPLRFRFLLDMTINSGVVITLGWLILGQTTSIDAAGFVPVLYSIADFVLFMMIVNLSLAKRMPRPTALAWGASLLAMAVSDYAYSFLSLYQSYHSGSITSLGWIVAFLLFGNEAIRERQSSAGSVRVRSRPPILDLGSQFQNILPVTLVLALCWYVFTNWQTSGELSRFGSLMSLLFSVILIVRLGIRAGEVELHQYWQLFSSLAEPAFICTTNGSILLGNPALTRLFDHGESGSSVEGESLYSLFAAPGLPADALVRVSNEAATYEVDLLAGQAPYSLTLSPIFGEGRRIMIAGVAHDLSRQKEQENAIRKGYRDLQTVHRQLEDLNAQLEARVDERTHTLREAYQQLEEQHRALQELDHLKSDFVSMVSHELRTPLNNLGGGLELLLSKRRTAQVDEGTLKLMQAEIRRLTRFVENILNVSALDAGHLSLRPVPLSLSVVVDEVFRKRFQGPGAERIVVRVSPDLPLVLADETALESVLHHLLDNALKYAAEGTVLVEAEAGKKGVRVQVTDSGPGIPPEKRRLLFKKFQRLDAHDSQSVYGYGLGLYLSLRLLQAMSSNLAYESPAHGGARFYFVLKVAK